MRITSAIVALALSWAAPAFAQAPPLPAADEPARPDDTEEPARPDDPPRAAEDPTSAPQAPLPAPPPAEIVADATAAEGPPRHDLVRVNLGLRIGYVSSDAFDTFASSDALTQGSIDATYPVLTRGKLVLAAGLGWDFGARSDGLRGIGAQVVAHRLYVPVEGRYHLLPGLAVFGKLAPGALVALSSVDDPSAPNELTGTGWAFSADLSAGASILVGGRDRLAQRKARVWVTPEIGYALTTAAPVRANPHRAEEDLLGADADTNLRSVAFSGLFWRASLGMTF